MLMFLLAYVSPGDSTLVLLSCGLAGALGGFLWFNFPPARIYMGDGGAYFLGCFIAASTISSSQKGTVMAALVAPMFVLALPILDTSLAILRRGLRGLPIFRPDRRHIHHHLQEMGFSRRKVVLSLYVFTLVFLLLGMAAFTLRGQWIPILAGVGILLVLYTAGKLRFSREWFAVGRMVGNSLSMRGEVRYALIHTQWLRLEAHRASSMDVLWQDLVFVAQKLGFNGLRLQLEDAERSWQSPEAGPMRFRTTHRLRCGQTIALELTAGQNPEARESDVSETRVSRLRSHQEQIKDKKLFLILAELLAECFDKTLTVWSRDHGLPLCFDPQAIPNRSESETLPGSILAGLSPMTPRPKVKS